MTRRQAASLVFGFSFLLLPSLSALAQTQTTGRIAGTVKDQNGAVIVSAEVTVVSRTTGDERKVTTDATGDYTVALLLPGTYRIGVAANGFSTQIFDTVQVVITETTLVDADLTVAGVIADPVVVRIAPLVHRDGPQLGRVVGSRAVSELPLATRNFTQILGLSPGTSVDLPDNTAVGRNSQNASVNGARSTQNNFQINGVNALSIHTNS